VVRWHQHIMGINNHNVATSGVGQAHSSEEAG